jgi:hypothetical protein
MTDVAYQVNSDRPLSGPRIECMVEILFDLTAQDLRGLAACQADDWIQAVCLALNALPSEWMRVQGVKMIARRYSRRIGEAEQCIIVALGERLEDEKVAWMVEKRAHYQLPDGRS